MKTNLTLFILLCSFGAFGQVIKTTAGDINLQTAQHNEGYLISKTDAEDKTKIIWYPKYSLYRECGNFKDLNAVPAGYYYKKDDCNCDEDFPGKFTSTGVAASTAPYANIQFDFDSSVLKTSNYPLLDASSAALRSTGAVVELDGYASSEGSAAHNMRLSRERANSVKAYLVNSGVSSEKIKIKAYGETHPIADNSTEEGRALNRRVEFHRK